MKFTGKDEKSKNWKNYVYPSDSVSNTPSSQYLGCCLLRSKWIERTMSNNYIGFPWVSYSDSNSPGSKTFFQYFQLGYGILHRLPDCRTTLLFSKTAGIIHRVCGLCRHYSGGFVYSIFVKRYSFTVRQGKSYENIFLRTVTENEFKKMLCFFLWKQDEQSHCSCLSQRVNWYSFHVEFYRKFFVKGFTQKSWLWEKFVQRVGDFNRLQINLLSQRCNFYLDLLKGFCPVNCLEIKDFNVDNHRVISANIPEVESNTKSYERKRRGRPIKKAVTRVPSSLHFKPNSGKNSEKEYLSTTNINKFPDFSVLKGKFQSYKSSFQVHYLLRGLISNLSVQIKFYSSLRRTQSPVIQG